jgi:hypothetical protein
MPRTDDEPPGDEQHTNVVSRVANVTERIAPLGAGLLTGIAATTEAAVAHRNSEVTFLIASAVAGLLPVTVVVVERQRERAEREKVTRAWADAAWDAIIAAREG